MMDIFITVLLLCIVISLCKKAYTTPRIKGWLGEMRVRRHLNRLTDVYTSYHNVYLQKANGELTQVDHIVTAPFGIFVIETKNYAGRIVGTEEARYWTQILYQKKTTFYSPIFQNRAHVNVLKHTLQVDVPIRSVIVFSNAVTLKLPALEQATVIQMKHLRKYMKKYNEEVIAQEQLRSINATIEQLVSKERAEKRQLKHTHLQQLKRNERIYEQHASPCPKCGSKLVKRKGKFGAFYGCSTFPACRFTERTESE